MEVLYPRCAGLDVHKDIIVVCVRCVSEPVVHEVRAFGSMTSELLELGDWLQSHGVTHAAMEATGVYWKPVWHLLDGRCELILANAAHVRNVPGRKTDVNDATWLADLLAHGLIRSSFVPPEPIQELRDLMRTRKQLVREVAQHSQRIQKVLEDANIKLGSVLSDILTKTGRAILDAIVAGESHPEVLADLALGTAKKKRSAIIESLRGYATPHHRRMIGLHLRLIAALEHELAQVDAAVGNASRPISEAAELLKTIPGFSDTVAHVVISEIGLDMSRFPTAGHLISWAGLCPRNDESAGKRRSTRVRKSGTWLKTTLVTAAWSAVRKKDSYLKSQFLRLKSRRGPKKAILAVAATMLTATYHMLRGQVPYQDLGPDHFERVDRTKAIRRLVDKLERLGCEVDVKQAA